MASLLEIVPTGSIVCYTDFAIPDRWLVCDGGAYSTSQYRRLFQVIGYRFGSSGTRFRVPDMRDIFSRGPTSSRDVGTRQQDAIQSHSHQTNSDSGGTKFITGWDRLAGQKDPVLNIELNETSGDLVHEPEQVNIRIDTNIDNLDQNDFDANETRPQNIALVHIIKY